MNNASLLATTQLLIEIRAFQHHRWKQGNPVSIESLLQAHPQVRNDDDSLLELIYGEFCVRENLAQEPTSEEYCERFPTVAERLERLLEVHRALDSGMPSFASVQQTVHASNDSSVSISPELTTRIHPSPTGEREEKHQPTAMLGRFGDYHLLNEIDRGGMGVVYRARQIQANRIVALKMILAGKFATKKELKRFYSEAEAAAKLDHPNIVPIYDIGEHDGHPFFTMAYVDGENLASRLMHGPLGEREAAALIKEVSQAIHYAHQQGIVHRDLKPANILLTKTGQTRITDFGLAKRIGDQSELTVTGDVVGTPSYMSPEQINGSTGEVGIRSDVYSLGAILYCLLTGRPPFQAATILETFTQLTQSEPVPPRQFVSTISQDLETICLKCLQKAPGKRYPSTAELVADLDHFLEGKPVQARPVSQWEHAWRWCQRKPLIASLSAAVGLLVFLVAIVSTVAALHLRTMAWNENQARLQAMHQTSMAKNHLKAVQKAQKTAQENLLTAQQAKQAAQANAYAAHMNIAQMSWNDSHIENVLNLLKDHREQELRGFEWHYLQRLCHQDLTTSKSNSLVNSAAYLPNSNQLLLVNSRGELVYWDLLQQRQVFSQRLHTGKANQLSLSPDGKTLATAGDDKAIILWDVERKTLLQTLTGHTSKVLSVSFNFDGSQLASGSSDKTAKIWNLASGQCEQTLAGHRYEILSVAFNSQGSLLATGSNDATARIWDLPSGQTRHVIQHRQAVDSVQFSPRLALLATGSSDGSIQLWSTTQLRLLKTIESNQLAIRQLQFHPNGMQLASAGADSTVKLWQVPLGKRIRTYQGHLKPVRCLAFHSDGTELVSASWDLTIKKWSLATSPSVLDAHRHAIQDLDYSHDGKWLATASVDKTIKLWQMPNRQLDYVFSDIQSPVRTVQFSPNGQWLAAGTADGILYVWDLQTRQLKTKRMAHQKQINQVAFTSDSCTIGSVSNDGHIKLWNLTSDQPVGDIEGHRGAINTISFSPDGSRFVTGGLDSTLRIWDRPQQHLLKEIPGNQQSILTADWSPDGKWIASSGYDRLIHVWDVNLGIKRDTLKGHKRPVTQVRFSPDSQRIVSASYDFSLKLWDVIYGNQIFTLSGHRGVTWCAQFSPQGDWIASGSGDRQIRLWDGRPANTETTRLIPQALSSR